MLSRKNDRSEVLKKKHKEAQKYLNANRITGILTPATF